MTPTPRIYALIVAAGVGQRAGGDCPKQYVRVGGKALLAYSVEALARHPSIAGVQVVIHAGHREYYDEAVGLGVSLPAGEATRLNERSEFSRSGEGDAPQADRRPHPDLQPNAPSGVWANPTSPAGRGALVAPLSSKLLPPVFGGKQRADSVREGLAALASHKPEYVLIHDAARPFLSHGIIDALIEKLTPETGVVPALAVADTVRRFDGGAWQEVAREGLLRVQTPQAFPFAALQKNYATGAASTDEAAVWLAAGRELRYVAGDEELRKVTTAGDIVWANQIIASTRRVAVGMGYDVHALVPSGEAGVIRLGGIDIANGHKLHGHSDADVVLHAVVDALLGSVAAGDIGSHFPPSDARWKGANSSIFIEEACTQVAARGGEISHLDITIIGEKPKIFPHRDAMRASIASMLRLPLSRVSVKATTTEKLGFTGREEGIACQAIATVSLPAEAA